MTDLQHLTDLRQSFSRQFPAHKTPPRIFRAPGRTNIIGEHTDYNDGFVLPAAIDRATYLAIAPRESHVLRIHSEHFSETVSFNLRETLATPRRDWTDYVRGVAILLKESGIPVQSADILIRSDVPLGAGLSSSASLEVATAFALIALANRDLPKIEIAQLCQRAENEFVGAHVGIMDQFVSCFGQSNHAIFLDCRSLAHQAVPLPTNVRLIMCNTMVKHEIASGAYNERRGDCDEAVARLENVVPGIRALRDVTPDLLQQHANLLPDLLYRRARHVVTENARVLAAREALLNNNLESLGALMQKSHASLRDDYEVSCNELDVMVNIANNFPGCIGSRMTGGGFGGCTINLVLTDQVEQFAIHIREGYQGATGIAPEIYSCAASDGAAEIRTSP
jgi:galactokinase